MNSRTVRPALLATALLCAASGMSLVTAQDRDPVHGGVHTMNASVLSFTMKANDGTPKPLADYKGKVLLIVNTASECGYTPQYEGLEKLYEKYRDRGLVVLAFPANEFGAQEPGTDEQIKTFCSTKYHVTFPIFAKSVVKGQGINPLYKFLTTEAGFNGDITWNFNKFLVDRSGKVVARYDSKVTPQSDQLVAEVEKLLAQPA